MIRENKGNLYICIMLDYFHKIKDIRLPTINRKEGLIFIETRDIRALENNSKALAGAYTFSIYVEYDRKWRQGQGDKRKEGITPS